MFFISHEGKWFRFLMVFIFLGAAMETDIYLPTFPDILSDFNTNAVMVQRILSYNFIGICLGSLLYGPLSDHFGRRKVLIFGFSIFLTASIGCIFSTSIEQLLAFRLLQGFGSSACVIVGTAMIFDLFEEESAAKLISDLNTLVVSLMAFAPLIGGWISLHLGYKANFVFIAVLVLISALKCFLFLPESLAVNKRKKLAPKRILSDYKTVLSSTEFWYNTLVTSLILGAYMIYVSNMSLLYIDKLGVSPKQFPFYQMATLGTFVLVSLNNSRLIDKFGVEKLKATGLGLIFANTLIFFISPSNLLDSPVFLTATMCLFSIGAGLSIGLFFAKSMQVFPELTGIAASLVTAIRLFIVSAAIDIGSNAYKGTSQSVVQIMTLVVLVLAILWLANYVHMKKMSGLSDAS
ncbi:major facilitator superfamily permease [Vibrio campbellii]|uniref:multidrug effflux MFS transporter n=1 Tax=Vibrio campbellii TaxID=680 RepID=UPI000530FBE3|nr:multidrug effflux MFS transporter [Vibrio campbellii]KGR36017.1 major facilitator superfamily permease [Vibrio campbellii]